ncbi:MAG: hypothetical protein AAGG01_18050 [Planctomycetota bacterium]
MKCPSCSYVRQEHDTHVVAGICPSCGIAYAKYRPPDAAPEQTPDAPEPERAQLIDADEDPGTFRERLAETFLYVPDEVDRTAFWGRVALYAVFVLWGSSFILGGVDWESIGGSFLHNVNLPFHEFGHVLFGFFGTFMGILGGSLFQVLMPLIALVSFTVQMRDNFAASIMLWWCGQNMIDVSPYIADAPYRNLPLILGMGEDAHDWWNLLGMLGMLEQADEIANAVFFCGCVTMLLSFAWGALILRRQQVALRD